MRLTGSNHFVATTKGETVADADISNTAGHKMFLAGAAVPKGTELLIKAATQAGPGGPQTNYSTVFAK